MSVPVPAENIQAAERVAYYIGRYQLIDLVMANGMAIRDFKERLVRVHNEYLLGRNRK